MAPVYFMNKVKQRMKRKFPFLVYLLVFMTMTIPLLGCSASAATGFEVLSIGVNSPEVITGEKFNVSAEIANAGTNEATYTVQARINGIVDDRKDITLAPGKSQEVEFIFSRSQAGQYEINVGSKNIVVNVVEPLPAAFKVSNLEINADQVNPGDEVVITADVENTGGSIGTYIAGLSVNGSVEQSQKLNIPPATKTFVVFKVVKNDPGSYAINIGDLTGKLTVIKPIRQIQIATPTVTETPYQRQSQWQKSSSSCCPGGGSCQ